VNQEKQDQLIRSYLLGDLPAHEREQVEARYFADPDFLEEMDAVEAELIEDYALGALSAEQAQKVKERVLNSPYQLEKLKFAETLTTVDDGETRRQTWVEALRGFFSQQHWPSFAISVAAVALLIIGGLIFEISRMRRSLDNLRQEQAGLKQQEQTSRETIAQLQKQIEQMSGKPQPSPEERRNDLVKAPSPSPPTTRLAIFMLRSAVIRSSQEKPPEALIPLDAAEVSLQLVYEGKRHSSYQAVLENADGDELWRKSGLKITRDGNQNTVNFDIPARNLIENKTYIVRLKARMASSYEEVGIYDFIAKRP
jgi:hypothetical protein